MKVDTQDTLKWLYPDSRPSRRPRHEVAIETARRCRPGLQVLVADVPEGEPIKVTVSPLKRSAGGTLARTDLFQLVSVPVETNTGAVGFTNESEKNEHVTRRAPFRVFDAMRPINGQAVAREGSDAVLIQFPVAANARPGTYNGTVEVAADGESVRVAVKLIVHEALVPKRGGLKFTNWFNLDLMAERHGLEPWGRAHWRMIRRYAQLMVRNRQNMFWAPLSLIEMDRGPDGRWSFDFDRWTKLIRTFLDAGMEWIEGGHLASRRGWDDTRYHARCPEDILATDGEGHLFYSRFLPELLAVVQRSGWRDIYIQHVSDEPHGEDVPDYRLLCGIVRKFMPGVPLIDATCHTDLHGALDIYVPQNWKYEDERDQWAEYRQAGDEIWHYTCCFPGGVYLNRLLDNELLRPCLLHWGNYRYDLAGFLHWGLNQYRPEQNPFEQSVVDHGGGNNLPPGDTHIVYPGQGRPWSSMRFETHREGIEHYELLRRVAESDPGTADAITRRVLRGFGDYTTNVDTLRGAYNDLLAAADEA